MLAAMVLCTVSASAQWNNNSQPYSSPQAPTATFRSTSAMQGSNSAYASTPAIGADGIAESIHSVAHPGNPRKVGPPTPEGDPTPLGDALPMLLMLAALYALRITAKKTQIIPHR